MNKIRLSIAALSCVLTLSALGQDSISEQDPSSNGLAVEDLAVAQVKLYQLQTGGKILRYTGTPCSGGTCTGWQLLDQNPAIFMIAASTNGLFKLHSDGKVYRYTGIAVRCRWL